MKKLIYPLAFVFILHFTLNINNCSAQWVQGNGIYGVIVGIVPISNEVPSSYSLSQNYPNPFNPTTKINFAIPKSGMVSLKIYNILGKEVSTLVNQNMGVGIYTYEFDASRLSSGIYFYRLNVNGFSAVKKMSLVK